MHGNWAQMMVAGILGAGVWSALSGTPALPPVEHASPPLAAESSAEVATALPPSASPSEAPPVHEEPPSVFTASPSASPSQSPSASPSAAPQTPILRGTIVIPNGNLAIFEYQGAQRVVREGDLIGPYRVGGVYPKQASLSLQGSKTFVAIQAPTPAPNAQPRPTSSQPDGWVRSIAVTQVARDGGCIGLYLRSNGISPLQAHGVFADDVIKSVNGRPLRSQEDLWWLYQELQHAPRLAITLERSGQEQTLMQERSR